MAKLLGTSVVLVVVLCRDVALAVGLEGLAQGVLAPEEGHPEAERGDERGHGEQAQAEVEAGLLAEDLGARRRRHRRRLEVGGACLGAADDHLHLVGGGTDRQAERYGARRVPRRERRDVLALERGPHVGEELADGAGVVGSQRLAARPLGHLGQRPEARMVRAHREQRTTGSPHRRLGMPSRRLREGVLTVGEHDDVGLNVALLEERCRPDDRVVGGGEGAEGKLSTAARSRSVSVVKSCTTLTSLLNDTMAIWSFGALLEMNSRTASRTRSISAPSCIESEASTARTMPSACSSASGTAVDASTRSPASRTTRSVRSLRSPW